MKKFSQWIEENYGSVAGEPRDEKWLAQQRSRLMTWSLEDLISWLKWNDPNGSYSDEEAEIEGMDPLGLEDAVELVMKHVEENLETPEEMRAASARARINPIQGATPLAWDARGLMSRSR